MEVKKGSKVKVSYTGKLDDGQVFDTSEGKDPLEFEVGAGMIIPGFEQGIMGMKEGEEKEIKIEAKDAYGERDDNNVQAIPKDQVNVGQEVKEGMTLAVQAPDGQKVPVKVSKVDDQNVFIDMNHPLAGKNLTFNVKIEDIE